MIVAKVSEVPRLSLTATSLVSTIRSWLRASRYPVHDSRQHERGSWDEITYKEVNSSLTTERSRHRSDNQNSV